MVDRLVEECTENNIDKTRLVENKNKNDNKCSSCIVFIVLFLINLKINIGIATYFAYYRWYSKKTKKNILLNTCKQTTIY